MRQKTQDTRVIRRRAVRAKKSNRCTSTTDVSTVLSYVVVLCMYLWSVACLTSEQTNQPNDNFPFSLFLFFLTKKKDPSLDARRCSCQNPTTHIDCNDLLTRSPTVASGGSSSWVIATAVGASVFIIVTAALVSVWRRRKIGASGTAGAGGSGDGSSRTSRFRDHEGDVAMR